MKHGAITKKRRSGLRVTRGAVALTTPQFADGANLSESMVRKMIRTGQLRVVRIGRSVRIPKSELLRLFAL
jgi:excisionase family DNA binding protein